MIFKYSKITTDGPFGTVIQHRQVEDETETQLVTVLGEIDNEIYIHVPSDDVLTDQPEELNFTQVTMTNELKDKLKEQSLVTMKKNNVRRKIEIEVGDVHDLIADCMKLIELNFVLTSRIAADYFGTAPLPKEIKTVYAQRNQSILDGIDSGQIKLRGSFEDVDSLMGELIVRYSKIQELVNSEYLSELEKIDLK